MPLAVAQGMPLAALTTLELGGEAHAYVALSDDGDLRELLTTLQGPVRILGGGSNLVVPDAGVDGTVVHMQTRGVVLRELGEGRVEVTAKAGEGWQDLVNLSLDENLAGLECLTGIPGSVGATPIQNVGAYGQEVADTLSEVEVFEPASGARHWLSRADCAFAYRDSRFKREPGRFIVLAARFVLQRGGAPTIRYGELSRALDARGKAPSLRETAETVYGLRAGKSMVRSDNDPNRRCAGSFFKNPILCDDHADAVVRACIESGLVERSDQVPRHPAGDGVSKLAAGWLIERAGFSKGLRRGAVGLSTKHALSLVHHGGGTTRELLTLAAEIQSGVRERFGVELEIEPVCW